MAKLVTAGQLQTAVERVSNRDPYVFHMSIRFVSTKYEGTITESDVTVSRLVEMSSEGRPVICICDFDGTGIVNCFLGFIYGGNVVYFYGLNEDAGGVHVLGFSISEGTNGPAVWIGIKNYLFQWE